MKKIISIVLAIALVICLCTVSAFAAEDYEVDLSTLSGSAANYSAHGYGDRVLVMFGYGTVVSLGTIDLSQYDACEITYATDLGYKAFQDGMKATAMWALKSNAESIGYVDVGPNEDGLLGKADCVDAYITNESGANWDKGERVATIDLSGVDYNGEVFLSHFNSTGNEGLCVGIKFVAKAEAAAELSVHGRSFDAFVTNYVNILTGEYTIVDLGPVDGSDGSIANVGYYGWVGFEEAIDSFGYQINDDAPVFDSAFSFTTEDDIKLAENGGEYGQRFLIVVPTSELKGVNTIKAVVKLASGTVVDLDGATYGKDLPNTVIEYTGPAAPETDIPQTGDMTVAMFAVIAVLALGTAVVFMKKRTF